ncbi:MAG: mycothiol conjugate amidase Mca [Microbacteriaceae bacterium]
MTRRLLAVHAHPDDESSKGAATYAYYRSRGAEVMVVSCTGGERGDIQNDGLQDRAMAERDMAGLRRIELERAQQVIGFQHCWLGYVDSGMPADGEPIPANCFASIPVEISAAPLVRVIRRFRPQVLHTYDESGGYPHLDHIRTHQVAMFALEAAADGTRYPEAGPAWQISKLYYDRMFSSLRVNTIYDLVVEQDPQSPLLEQLAELREWMRDRPYLATTQIPVGEFFGARDAALRAHASQVAPDSRFFFLPNELQQQAWPYEDFQLAHSRVETTMPETDLFSGIPDDEER